MTIKFRPSGSGKGYGKYILREGKNLSDAELGKIKVLSGDMTLGDEIVRSSNYKDNAFNIVLGFKGSISPAKASAVLEDFEKLFMHGFEKDEYHIDAVLHQDVDNHHIHIRIPKKNLLTDTSLRLYMDSVDRKRVNQIRDFIELKHDLERVVDNLKLVPNIDKEDIIQKHRAERGQEPFDFSKKKGRDQAQKQIVSYIEELHQAELINSIDDVRAVLKDIGLTPSQKQGHDFKTDTYYITTSNDTGKLALKGELFNERFYTQFEREDRQEQIENNRSSRRTEQRADADFQSISKALERSLDKRYQEVKKRYEPQRARARERHRQIQEEQPKTDTRGAEQEQQPLQHHTSVANNDISSTSISNSQKLEREANSEQVDDPKEISTREHQRKIYRHTEQRLEKFERRKERIYQTKRGISGTHRNTTGRHRETEDRERTERRRAIEEIRESRDSLHERVNQYQSEVLNRVGTSEPELLRKAGENSRAEQIKRKIRERFRGAIDSFGDEVFSKFSRIIGKFGELIRQSENITRTAERYKLEREQKPEQDYSYQMPSM